MNSRKRRLEYIRYKNQAKKRGFCLPKWTLKNRYWPFIWINNSDNFLEEKFIVDLGLL